MLACLVAAPRAAALGVDLLPASAEVVFGAAPLPFQAVAQMGDEPVAWAWSVVESDGGAVLADPATGSAHYYPPFVLAPTVFHIRASAADGSGRSAEAAVQVHPHGAFRKGGPVAIIDAYAGQHWHLPRLERLAGALKGLHSRDGHGAEARFSIITDLLWVPWHPDRRLSGRWLVADDGSLRTVTPEGTVETYLQRPQLQDVTDQLGADAGAPPDPGEPETGSPWQGCTHLALDPGRGGGNVPVLYLCSPEGTLAVLDGKGAIAPVPADRSRFGSIGGMAVDGDGRLWVTCPETGVVNIVSRDGLVRTLAGKKGQRRRVDGGPGQGRLEEPGAIAMDPRTGSALVQDRHVIRWVHPDGSLSTLRERPQGAAAGADGPEPRFSGGRPFWGSPTGLAVIGDFLLVTNQSDSLGVPVSLIHLRTGARTALARPRVGVLAAQEGPLAGTPGVPAEAWAVLPESQAVAFAPPGEALVEANGEVFRLVLPALPGPVPLPVAETESKATPAAVGAESRKREFSLAGPLPEPGPKRQRTGNPADSGPQPAAEPTSQPGEQAPGAFQPLTGSASES
jgi:hypothetical protein